LPSGLPGQLRSWRFGWVLGSHDALAIRNEDFFGGRPTSGAVQQADHKNT